MMPELPHDDSKRLLQLCKTGRLYDIEEWVRSGKSLKVPDGSRKTPLSVALRAGFHSLLELLLRHESSQQSKNAVLEEAVQMRRPDLVELAVKYGAEPASIPFGDVLLSWDRTNALFFLEGGADVITEAPFARAFHARVRTALGCYLECKRRRPELVTQLQEQVDIALRQFCREGNLKWVSLLMWAGGGPRSKGPSLEYLDDPEMSTTALDEACTWGHLDVLKKLQPDPNRDDLSSLLCAASLFARTEIMAYLLSLGADPNDQAGGGSRALDGCIGHLRWEDVDAPFYGGRNRQTPAYMVSRSREAIRLLVEHEAIWRPEEHLNSYRRTLCQIEPTVTVEIVGLLLKHGACADAVLHDLLRTRRMQEHLASCERRLARVGLTLDGQRRAEVRKAGIPAPSPFVLSRYDREELYREVWAEPTRTVAARYGISDARLAKICRQLKVPKPPRGYWAKKGAGRPVPRQPRLPSAP